MVGWLPERVWRAQRQPRRSEGTVDRRIGQRRTEGVVDRRIGQGRTEDAVDHGVDKGRAEARKRWRRKRDFPQELRVHDARRKEKERGTTEPVVR